MDEVQYLMQRCVCRRPGSVDEVLGEHRVWRQRGGRVRVLVIEFYGDERVAEMLTKERKSFGRHKDIAAEA